MRLVGESGALRLVEPKSGRDLTDAMSDFASKRVAALAATDLGGFILKKDSPSCGMERVKVWHEQGQNTRTGQGIFATPQTDKRPMRS